MQIIEEEVIKAIKYLVEKKICLTKNTRIYHDLGITGDDMYELLENIQNKFGTSFEKFDFIEYCPNDLDAFIDYIIFKIGLGGKWTPFTVGHLIQVVKSGSWFDP